MSLAIDLDIADAYVTERAFSVIDAALRARDPGLFGYQGTWPIPGDKGVTLLPDQVRADWGNTQAVRKWSLDDWALAPGRWEQIAKRGFGDWFLASKGLATTDGTSAGGPLSLTSRAPLRENGGLYVELYGYGVPGTRVPDLLQVVFGGGLVLHVHSDGRADVEDRRPGSPAQGSYLTKNQSLTANALTGGDQAGGGADLLGKQLGIVLLPYRRGRLLVVTNQGGVFEVGVGCRADGSDAYKDRRGPGEGFYYVTTEAGPVTLLPSPAVRALLAVNPLTCAQSPAGVLTSPIVPLPYDVATGPSQVLGAADAQDGAGVALSVIGPDGNPLAPSSEQRVSEIQYQIALSSPAPDVFPVFYALEMKWDRVLGQREYGTSALPTRRDGAHPAQGTVTGAHLTLSRDSQQKSFEVTLDNPGDAFTSVKDLWNRRIRCYFDAGGADGALGVAAGQRIVVFDGYTDPADFTDGRASKLTLPCTGRRKRLRSHLLSDSEKFDGQPHAQVVYTLLRNAGVDDADIVIYDYPDLAGDGAIPLDSAEPGDDPLWRPANGQSTDEFAQHIADTFSGWVFDDIGGTFYYVPKESFTAQALLADAAVPQVYLSTPAPGGLAATRPVNPSALVALDGSVKQSSKEPVANDFWVFGQDADGNLVSSHYVDAGSISDRHAANWVGERRVLIYASGSITTVDAAVRTLGPLVVTFGQAQRTVAFELPDYQIGRLPLEGPLILEGYGPALITDTDADLSCDRSRRTTHHCELLTDSNGNPL